MKVKIPPKVTASAFNKIMSIGGKKCLRVAVEGGGCSGFQYVWGLMNDNPDIKWSEPIDDVLVVDPLAELYILGSEIDYVTELGGSFLAVKNPTASSSCGCGESFGV